MSRLMKLAADGTHSRDVRTSVYTAGEGKLVAEGHLHDVRLNDWYKITGERIDKGTLHDLGIVILVKIPEMIIEDLEVIIGTVPREDCLKIADTMKPVIGMRIAGGFTSKVRESVGGVKGCTHLVHLLTSMAPAVMQGFWSFSARKAPDMNRPPRERGAESLRRGLKNSCITWREDGELYQKIIGMMNGDS